MSWGIVMLVNKVCSSLIFCTKRIMPEDEERCLKRLDDVSLFLVDRNGVDLLLSQ